MNWVDATPSSRSRPVDSAGVSSSLIAVGHALDATHLRIATELFYATAVPALIREIAEILRPCGIPIMPLKGALLQRWVYGTRVFRPLSDVDVLVPPARFDEARAALRAVGFTVEREEQGGWEVALRRPEGLLEIDLHRRLSSTVRSGLRAEDLFARGRHDTTLFRTDVVLPDPRDLYSHLLLHLTLNWLARGSLHHPEDLEAAPAALGLTPEGMVHHLACVGLEVHAALMLPHVSAAVTGAFSSRLYAALSPGRVTRLKVTAARMLSADTAPGTLARRMAGIVVAPSWLEAGRDALAKRLTL